MFHLQHLKKSDDKVHSQTNCFLNVTVAKTEQHEEEKKHYLDTLCLPLCKTTSGSLDVLGNLIIPC